MATAVDFPLLPVTAMVGAERTIAASSSARWAIGIPRSRAAPDVGDRVLDRGRGDDEVRAGDAGAVLRTDRDAEAIEPSARPAGDGS